MRPADAQCFNDGREAGYMTAEADDDESLRPMIKSSAREYVKTGKFTHLFYRSIYTYLKHKSRFSVNLMHIIDISCFAGLIKMHA
jgi:hypothetical protein